MLRPVVLVRTYVLKEGIAAVIIAIKIGEIATMLAVTSNRRTLRKKKINAGLLLSYFFDPEDRGDIFLRKRRLTLNVLSGITTQKTTLKFHENYTCCQHTYF
jgi:hypothetical protein